jgi:hypothetical protein
MFIRIRTGKGYTIEAAIPIGALGITNPWDSKKMIMDAVLNEGGMPGRGQYGWTTTTEAAKKSRGLWGFATLEPTLAPQMEISVNTSVAANNRVTVTGQTYNVQTRDVTILLLDPNGNTAYIDQQPSDAQGRYAFTFPINSDVFEAGLYTVIVGGDGVKRTNTTTFTYTPSPDIPGTVKATLTADRITVKKNSEVTVQVGLVDASNVSAEDITISYNPQILSYVNNTAAAVGMDSVIMDTDLNQAAGTIRFILANMGPDHTITGNAPVLTLNFMAVTAEGTGTIQVSRASVADPQGNKQEVNTSDAILNIETQPDHLDLVDLIADVRDIYDLAVVGIENGKYPNKAKGALLVAILSAEAVANNSSATADQLAQAITNLNAAVSKFQQLRITSTTGDFGAPGYDISEIGIFAGFYGVKSDDYRWNPNYDLDGDGEIGMYELSLVAKRFQFN